MEISKRELEQLMARQANRVAKESDKRIAGRFEAWGKQSDERMQRYIGGLKEDFDHKLDTVLEYVQDIPVMKQKLDATFEAVGALTVDVEVIKDAIKDHELRLQRLEMK